LLPSYTALSRKLFMLRCPFLPLLLLLGGGGLLRKTVDDREEEMCVGRKARQHVARCA